MNSHEDSAYRLTLAQTYLVRAESDAAASKWDQCLANAQAAVENAGKSILGHFRAVPWTHDLAPLMADLAKSQAVSPAIRKWIARDLDAFDEMGAKTHIRAAYGDEATRTPPWKLITESEAKAGLEQARRAVALAESILAEIEK